MWFLFALIALVWIAVPMWALFVAGGLQRELERLHERVRRLEAPREAAASEVTAPPAPLSALAERVSAEPTAARPFFDSARAEELVGGLWLQNIGAVIVLLGAFFSIVWGYTSGRLGPGVLVAAGVLFGLALTWRGDRLARSLPSIGHALIGVGLGIAYLAIYLGWFTLHVLGSMPALALLTLVSIRTIVAGLWYRAQAVAALGVIGAFVPQLLVGLLHLRGFSSGPGGLLAYIVLVDVVVFVLAARAEWSLLDLLALMLTCVAWGTTFVDGRWGWPLQAGLALLFAAGGLAPVARLARREGSAAPATLALIVASPLLLTVVSWPFLQRVAHVPAAMLLLALAAAYMAAAWWLDSRRASDDAWRPLTAAATLFATFALERLAQPSYLSLTWLAEGAALVWLGRGRRGAWLRACGAVVSAIGACVHLTLLVGHDSAQYWRMPFVHAESLRTLGGIVLLLLTGVLLRREEPGGAALSRLASRCWVIGALLMSLFYTSNESDHLAHTLAGSEDVRMLRAFLTSACWTLLAGALMAVGWTRRSAFLRWVGLGLLGLTVLKFALSDLGNVDVFWRFVSALLVGVTLLLVSFFYQRRMKRERGPKAA